MRKESKQQTAYTAADEMFEKLSNFENLTPMLGDKVEEWTATRDTCSFKAQGFRVGLQFDSEGTKNDGENFQIKVVGAESPLPFSFWLQLKKVGERETRLRVVLDAELNMMYKMMIGGKLQKAVDTLAEKIAESFSK